MFPDNNWYGHRLILSRYAKTKNIRTHCSIQHGSITHSYAKNFGRNKFPLSKYLVWNKKDQSKCHSNGNYNCKIIGAPFLYLDKLLNKKKYKLKKKSFFILVPHRSENIDAPFFHKKFIKYIKKKFIGKITACFFYADRNNEIDKLYIKNNIDIFSCGVRSNEQFLFLLYRQLKSHENIVITYIGSPLFYSLYLNKKTYFIKKFTPDVIIKNKIQIKNYELKNSILFKKLPASKLVDQNLGFELAKRELGFKFLRSPDEINKILWPKNFLLRIYTSICQILLYLKWYNKLIK